jgi:hypothetical protein
LQKTISTIYGPTQIIGGESFRMSIATPEENIAMGQASSNVLVITSKLT